MKKNKPLELLKTLFIFFLLFYSIYQFFDMSSDESVFQMIQDKVVSENEDDTYVISPQKTMISFGDKKYVLVKTNSTQDELVKKQSSDIFNEIFTSNKNFEVVKNDVLNILNERSIILCYDSYNENMTEFLFNIKNDKILKNIRRIDKIVIIPSSTSKEKSKVYIIENEDAYKFEIDCELFELYGLIDEINLFNQMNIYYLSENTDYKKSFNRYVFMPVIENDFTQINYAKNISITNPFKSNLYEIDEDAILNYSNLFFDNPNAKWRIEKDTSNVIFGDGERTITINKDGYVNYSYSVLSDEKVNFNKALKIALNKINEDIYLSKYLRLVDAKKNSDKEYEFYFDMYVNGIKVELSNTLKEKYKIDYQISIVVTGDNVSSYKGIILKVNDNNINENDENLNNKISLKNNNYENIIKETLSSFPDLVIKDLKIGYFNNSNADDTKLKWIVTTSDGYFTYDLY